MSLYINNDFSELSYDDMFSTVGGWDWDAFADFVGAVTIVSSVIPGGQCVTIVCGCYYAGYNLGKAISG